MPYKSYIYYLQPGTYTLEFKYNYVEPTASDDDIVPIEEFAAVHMLNADQDGGMTFIQELNGKNPIYNIISEIVHHFGGEDIDKIIVEDVDVYSRRSLR